MSDYERKQWENLKAAVELIMSRDPDAIGFAAEHDQFFIASDSEKLTDEDRQKLTELGFLTEYDSWYMFT